MRIGIDEISYKRGHKYLTVVVDHDTGRLVWAAPGRDMATLGRFFETLGTQRCEQIRLVSADAAEWIATVVRERCPNAEICADPFHMVAWATAALDEVRRTHWRAARKLGAPGMIRRIKGCRYALLKNPENLTDPLKRPAPGRHPTQTRIATLHFAGSVRGGVVSRAGEVCGPEG